MKIDCSYSYSWIPIHFDRMKTFHRCNCLLWTFFLYFDKQLPLFGSIFYFWVHWKYALKFSGYDGSSIWIFIGSNKRNYEAFAKPLTCWSQSVSMERPVTLYLFVDLDFHIFFLNFQHKNLFTNKQKKCAA